MAQVLLAPARLRHYQQSIEQSVRFGEGDLGATLTEDELALLLDWHPTGEANFWGAVPRHRNMMERLRPGDPVLFTGDKKLRGFGEFGALFTNEHFADSLWGRQKTGDSFYFVYTVLNVRQLERPIEDLWAIDGFTEGDYVFSQRPVRAEKADRLIDALSLHTTSAVETVFQDQLVAVSKAIAEGSRIVPPEARRTDSFSQRIAQRDEHRHRVEAQLVAHYRQANPDRTFNSFLTPDGLRTDLYYHDGDEVEIIEAKALTAHDKVRQAVAQLLDYAAQSPASVTRLTALFPTRPEEAGIQYLHRLGIDCLYRTEDNGYRREEASASRRRYMLPVWRGEASG